MVMSPQDVQGIMEMLDAVQKAEAAGKLPPGSAQAARDQMESEFEYSGRSVGRSANQGFTGAIGNPDPVRAPWRGEYDMPGNFERQQHMANSMANDAMLRELLGSERRRTEEDDVEGTFALSRYPGIESAIAGAEGGMAPAGMMPDMGSAKDKYMAAEKRRRWARKQRELLGMDRRIGRGEWKSFRRGMKGRGAREKLKAFRGFLGG